MKHTLVFVFLLIGLSFLDWSCGSCPDDVGPYPYHLSEVFAELEVADDDSTFQITHYTEGDTIHFKDLRIAFRYEFTASNYENIGLGFSSYAEGCDGPFPPQLSTIIDSLEVIELIDGIETEVTADFGIINESYNDTVLYSDKQIFLRTLNNSLYNESHQHMFLRKAPSLISKRSYRITLFDEEDQAFETLTMDVILKP